MCAARSRVCRRSTRRRTSAGSAAASTLPACATAASDNEPLWINADGATVDGVAFGVFDAGDCGASGPFHLEDIRIQGASDFTLLNSTFSAGSDAGSGHIFITTTSPSDSQPKRFRVENTIFPPVVGSYAIQIHTNVTSYDHYIYRNNRFDQPILDPAPYHGPHRLRQHGVSSTRRGRSPASPSSPTSTELALP